MGDLQRERERERRKGGGIHFLINWKIQFLGK